MPPCNVPEKQKPPAVKPEYAKNMLVKVKKVPKLLGYQSNGNNSSKLLII
jgi:hypothetical protein